MGSNVSYGRSWRRKTITPVTTIGTMARRLFDSMTPMLAPRTCLPGSIYQTISTIRGPILGWKGRIILCYVFCVYFFLEGRGLARREFSQNGPQCVKLGILPMPTYQSQDQVLR